MATTPSHGWELGRYCVQQEEQKVTFKAACGRNLDSAAASCGASWQLLAAPSHWWDGSGCLWAGQSQSWVSGRKSSCLDVFTLLPCRDCAKCEQTQQITQRWDGAVSCWVLGCEVTAGPEGELEQETKPDVHKHGCI